MQLIDFHAHIGEFTDLAAKSVWNFSTESVAALATKAGVAHMVVSQMEGLASKAGHPGEPPSLDELAANRLMLEGTLPFPELLPFLACQPGKGDARNIELLIKENPNRVYGLKFHPYFLALRADDRQYLPYIEVAAQNDLPCLFHSAPGDSDPKAIYSLARNFPHVPIILGHINMMGDYEEGIGAVREAVSEGRANLFLEISWVPPKALASALAQVGPERIIFGTDAPFRKEGRTVTAEEYAARIAEIDSVIRAAFPADPDTARELIFHGNAARLLFRKRTA